MHVTDLIDQLKQRGYYSDIDRQFAAFMNRLADDFSPELTLAAVLVSSFTQNGHICLDLPSIAGKAIPGYDNGEKPLTCPELSVWEGKLKSLSVVGRPGKYRPLILDDKSRLYLYRYWEYEKNLGQILKTKAAATPANVNREILRGGLCRLFSEDKHESLNLQKLAAYIAVTKNFCVISGGPGTGKTYTVAKILALLLEQDASLKIALISPTGKAAARLSESIGEARQTLNCSDSIRQLLPTEASTIHALLGSAYNSPYFKYNARNPLPHDLVVVEEVSMVDMALMSKLCQALSPQARLIFLGDKDQLSSVEAGAILGDICAPLSQYRYSDQLWQAYNELTGESFIDKKTGDENFVRDCIVQLEKSYRFGEQSGIGIISRAINAGDTAKALTVLKSDRHEDIAWRPLPSGNAMERELRKAVIANYRNYLEAENPEESLALFNRFRILGAVREGPFGVRALNFYIENILHAAGLIDKRTNWYHKRPIIITRNDYKLGLFNGDIGIIIAENGRTDEARAIFQAPDRTLRRISPVRLPEHETVYAVTVHKSQGSEFDRVLLILPEKPSPVLSRELLYTGVTRAKKHIEIWCPEKIFEYGLARTTQRTSGLTDLVWGPETP